MDNCVKYPERLLLRSHLNTGQKQQHTSDQNIEQICTASRAPEYQKLSIVCPRDPLFIYCLFVTQNKHALPALHTEIKWIVTLSLRRLQKKMQFFIELTLEGISLEAPEWIKLAERIIWKIFALENSRVGAVLINVQEVLLRYLLATR